MSSQRLGGVLRNLRRRAGMTQRELADRAGLSVGGLRDLEQGRVAAPRPDTLRRLAAGLGLSDVELHRQVSRDTLRVCVLGPLDVQVAGAGVDLGSTKQRTLLAMLALTPNATVSADVLVDAMWGPQPPARAMALLQSHVSRLRRRLQPEGRSPRLLQKTPGGYRLTVTEDQLDLLEWRQLVARAHAAHGEGDDERACEWYQRAVDLWRGEPVVDLTDLHAHPVVVELTAEWHRAVLEYADIATALGRHDQVLPALRQVTEADPLHEAAHARLMIALAGSGQQAAALHVFTALRQRLADMLGADPGSELVEAHRRVLRQEVPTPASAAVAPVPAHRQLPPDIADFTGRETELRSLRRTIADAVGTGTALVISAIEGMAGVGKTRLAVHLAHQLVRSGQYANVQLYADLRGYADEPPADPAAVLASFLHLLGVPSAHIPHDLDGRAALYRDRLHDRHALVLLDNAADEDQVRPLLPAVGTSLVLVTSRRTLALDGAHTVALDVFSPQDAQALLVRIVGQERVAADPDGARQVVELCGRLPLAVALAARRLRSRPAWQFADLVARLQDQGGRLGELAAGSRQVRTVFDLSYHALDTTSRRLFRLLGLHPGDDFTVASAAVLADLEPATTRRMLDHLVDEHLVIPVSTDRFRLHDLLREYATERAIADDGEAGAAAAVGRVLVWYLYAADAAIERFLPQRRFTSPLDAGRRPPRLPTFPDEERASQWLRAEHATLVAAVTTAVSWGHDEVAAYLPVVLTPYLDSLRGWDDWLGVGHIGLDAARRAGNRDIEAKTLVSLGIAYGKTGRLDDAAECLTMALAIQRERGDRIGQARSLNSLGLAYGNQKRYSEAIGFLTDSLEIYRELDNTHGMAVVLNNLGLAYAGAGQLADAIRCIQQTIEIRRRRDDRVGIALALWHLSEVSVTAGEHQDAVASLEEALGIFREAHVPVLTAETLEKLGDVLLAGGDPAAAREHWHQALAMYDELGHDHAEAVRAKLRRGAD